MSCNKKATSPGVPHRRQGVELFVEDRLPLAEGSAEANFFAIDDLAHELVVGGEIRVVGAHDLDHGIDHAAHDRRLDPDVRMAHGATKDAAQHIAPCLVRREHAVATSSDVERA